MNFFFLPRARLILCHWIIRHYIFSDLGFSFQSCQFSGSCSPIQQINLDELYEDNQAAPLYMGALGDEMWSQLHDTYGRNITNDLISAFCCWRESSSTQFLITHHPDSRASLSEYSNTISTTWSTRQWLVWLLYGKVVLPLIGWESGTSFFLSQSSSVVDAKPITFPHSNVNCSICVIKQDFEI